MTRLFSDHHLLALAGDERVLVERTRTLARERIGPEAAQVGARDTFAQETFDLLAAEGILATAFPSEYGGSDARQAVRIRIVEELGRVCSAAASLVTGTDLSARALVAGASDALKSELLPRLARGEIQSVFGLTEPGAGSDVRRLATTATPTAAGYRLNGAKKFITRAPTADWVLAVARLGGRGEGAAATGAKVETTAAEPRFVALLVPRGAPGLRIGAAVPKLGWYGVPIADIAFDDVFVPTAYRVGAEGEGFMLAQDALLRARIGHASMALGRAIGAVEIAAAYACERESFGKELGAHQGVQWMFAEMATRIEAARALVAAAADKYDRGDADTASFASMAKLHATDLGMQVVTDCLQLTGGRGYLADFPLERMFRDAKLNQIGEGASEIHKTVIGRELMRRSRAAERHPCLREGPLEAY
jgi:alkylation response protein AidB-like acyl-CoA dehydrogenase